MKATSDKIKGQANLTAGKAKAAVGELTGSNKMKMKGETQQLKGLRN